MGALILLTSFTVGSLLNSVFLNLKCNRYLIIYFLYKYYAKSVLSLWLLPIRKFYEFSTQAGQQFYLLSVISLDNEAVEVRVDASHCLLD